MTVFIVDQDAFYVATISKFLNLAGIKTVSVGNGHGGWSKFKDYQHQINAVVLDIPLLGIDGIQLTDLIRQAEPDLPIIVVSSRVLHKEEVLAAGATAFLEKPILFDTLLEEINKYQQDLD